MGLHPSCGLKISVQNFHSVTMSHFSIFCVVIATWSCMVRMSMALGDNTPLLKGQWAALKEVESFEVEGRELHTLTSVPDKGKVLLFGGVNAKGVCLDPYESTSVYDVELSFWQRPKPSFVSPPPLGKIHIHTFLSLSL